MTPTLSSCLRATLACATSLLAVLIAASPATAQIDDFEQQPPNGWSCMGMRGTVFCNGGGCATTAGDDVVDRNDWQRHHQRSGW